MHMVDFFFFQPEYYATMMISEDLSFPGSEQINLPEWLRPNRRPFSFYSASSKLKIHKVKSTPARMNKSKSLTVCTGVTNNRDWSLVIIENGLLAVTPTHFCGFRPEV